MVDVRTALAAVLSIGIGLVAIVAPGAVIRLQFAAYGPTTGRHGEYGGEREFDDRLRWLVRAVGVAALGVGVYVAVQPFL